MNEFIHKSTSELRKLVAEGFRKGQLLEVGQRPSAPTKVFRMSNKNTLINWLTNGRIKWGNYDSDGRPLSRPTASRVVMNEPTGSKATNEPTNPSQAKAEPSQAKDEPNTLKGGGFKITYPESETQYVTTNGVKKAIEVAQDLRLGENFRDIANAINDVTKKVDAVGNQSFTPTTSNTTIKINDRVVSKSKGVHYHKQFNKICNYTKWHKNTMLVGEAGTGKTTIANQVAKAFDLNFAHLSCSAGMSEAHLLGRMLFDGTYVESDFVRIYENGGVFLFDEFDALDGNCAVVMNSALANGSMSVPNRKDNPTAKRHPDCYIITACNTWGTGYGTNEYSGRNRLDQATLDRFCASKVPFDYDTKLESILSNGNKHLFNALTLLRKRVKEYKIRRVISTRLFERGAVALANGESIKEYFNTITIDWTKEEKRKVSISDVLTSTEGAK